METNIYQKFPLLPLAKPSEQMVEQAVPSAIQAKPSANKRLRLPVPNRRLPKRPRLQGCQRKGPPKRARGLTPAMAKQTAKRRLPHPSKRPDTVCMKKQTADACKVVSLYKQATNATWRLMRSLSDRSNGRNPTFAKDASPNKRARSRNKFQGPHTE